MMELSGLGLCDLLKLKRCEHKSKHASSATPSRPTLNAQNLKLRIPVAFKRTGHEMRLVLNQPGHEKTDGLASAASTHALRKAIYNGMRWNDDLVRGQATSMADIAQRENVNERYVSRMIRLAFLPPNIIEDVVRGEAPTSLTLERLKTQTPTVWGADA